MNRLSWKTTLGLLALLIPARMAVADPPDLKPLPIGSAAPDFHLPGVDGKTYSLEDFAAAKVLVVIFTCNHCPTAQAYEGRIARLHADYRDKGVAVVAISPNDPAAVRLDELGYTDLGDSFEDMKIRAKDHNFAYPYLYDGETQATAQGVRRAGHAARLHLRRRAQAPLRRPIRRRARSKAVKSHDAKNAVDALLAGKPVPVETTRVFGCSTKWAEKQADARKSLAKWDAEPVALEPIDIDAAWPSSPRTTPRSCCVVNLWATWCGPCVAELPELVTMNRMYRGRQLPARHDQPGRPRQAGRRAAGPQGEPRLGDQLHPELDRPRQVRRGARPGVARPGPLHARDRAGRQDPLPQDRRDRPARSQAGHRRLPRTHLLNSQSGWHWLCQCVPASSPRSHWPTLLSGTGDLWVALAVPVRASVELREPPVEPLDVVSR